MRSYNILLAIMNPPRGEKWPWRYRNQVPRRHWWKFEEPPRPAPRKRKRRVNKGGATNG